MSGVLAVLDFHIADMSGSGVRYAQREELIAARTAVAELIEAATELAEAGAEAWGDKRPCVAITNAAIARAKSTPKLWDCQQCGDTEGNKSFGGVICTACEEDNRARANGGQS